MLAAIAVLCFVVLAFGGDIAGLDLLAIGLAFLAAHFVFPFTPWNKNRSN